MYTHALSFHFLSYHLTTYILLDKTVGKQGFSCTFTEETTKKIVFQSKSPIGSSCRRISQTKLIGRDDKDITWMCAVHELG